MAMSDWTSGKREEEEEKKKRSGEGQEDGDNSDSLGPRLLHPPG